MDQSWIPATKLITSFTDCARQTKPLLRQAIASALGVLISLGVCAVPSNAAPKCNQLTLADSVQLAPATSIELLKGPTAIVQGGDPLMVAPLSTTVQRSIPALWTARIAQHSGLSSYNVDYTLVGANHCNDCLSGAKPTDRNIPVVIQPLPLQVQTNNSAQYKDCLNVSGGVNLILDLKSIQQAGIYSGQLWVTLHQL